MIDSSIGILSLMVLGVIIIGILVEILILVHRQDKKIRELGHRHDLVEKALTDEQKEMN